MQQQAISNISCLLQPKVIKMLIDIVKELYIPTIHALGLKVDEDNKVYQDGEVRRDIVLKEKQLVMPTPEIIRNIDNSKMVCFHPLSENIARGDSMIITLIKNLMTCSANRTLIHVLHGLMDLAVLAATDPSSVNLKGSQLDLVTILPDVNKTSNTNLIHALGELDIKTVKGISFYCKRNGKIGDAQYMRVSTVSFPMLSEINDPTKSKVWSHTRYRKRDMVDFRKLFEFVLPGFDTPGTYSVGSDSTEAPTFAALVRSYVKVMSRLNTVIDTYQDYIKDFGAIRYDLSVAEALNNLTRYRGLIPPLEGNIGAAGKTEEEPKTSITAGVNNWDVTQNIPNVTEVATQQQQQPVQQSTGWNQPQETQSTWGNPPPNPATQSPYYIEQPKAYSTWGQGNQQQQQQQQGPLNPIADWVASTGGSSSWGDNQGWGQQQQQTTMYGTAPAVSTIGLNNNQNQGWDQQQQSWGQQQQQGSWGNNNQNQGWGQPNNGGFARRN